MGARGRVGPSRSGRRAQTMGGRRMARSIHEPHEGAPRADCGPPRPCASASNSGYAGAKLERPTRWGLACGKKAKKFRKVRRVAAVAAVASSSCSSPCLPPRRRGLDRLRSSGQDSAADENHRERSRRTAGRPVPVVVAPVRTGDLSVYPHRARLGHPAQHRHGEEPRRWPADEDALHRGSGRPRRRRARRDRPSTVPGAAHPGGRAARPRPGQPRERAPRPRALSGGWHSRK